MLGDKQEAKFGGVMSGRNVQVIPVSVLRFWRYFIFKYVLFVARYLICAIDVNVGEKSNFWKQFWSRRRQCIKMAGTSRRWDGVHATGPQYEATRMDGVPRGL